MTSDRPGKRLDPIVASERVRGNVVARDWQLEPGPHGGYVTLEFFHPLDLDAIRAEFDLLESIEVRQPPDAPTSVVVDQVVGDGIVGGSAARGERATRALELWWARWEAEPRPRVPVGSPKPTGR